MKKILLFGAGKSATSLIRYLVQATGSRGWQLTVAESNLALAQSKVGQAAHARAVSVQVENAAERDALIREADLVISLLPPALHYLVAQSSVQWKKHLLTASYLDDNMRGLEKEINAAGLLFLCEMGLDPGIDHMSAMQLIHRIKGEQGEIVSFRSHTGGLVAPESDDNPWHYKISWNPRNVVMAGSAGARYRENGRIVERGYAALFEDCREVSLDGLGQLAWYPNRDSLSYIPVYGLENTRDFIRTTLRYPSFCQDWKNVVLTGLTNDRDPVDPTGLSFAQWAEPLQSFVTPANNDAYAFLGFFDTTHVPATARTSADILQHLLETRLAMHPQDRDMIVMLHEIDYRPAGATELVGLRSSLIVKGEDSLYTAMARTVGMPLGIAAIQILEGQITLRGLHIPILPEIYEPVLKELGEWGVRFEEKEVVPV